MGCNRLVLAGWAKWARPVGVITWEVEGVDGWARFVFVARVSVDSGRCLPTTGSCPVHVLAWAGAIIFAGAVKIVACTTCKTGTVAVTGAGTVLVLWADCIIALLALRVCGASTFANCNLRFFTIAARRAGIGIRRF